jgi:dolichol-phosphate mannosyltransferase
VAETRVLVVIPTYNERESLPALIDTLRALQFDVLIIDDASPDGTGEYIDFRVIADTHVHVLHRPKKLGLGSAYREGFQWALQQDYEIIIQMDADGSHDPNALPAMIAKLQKNDVVIGSRYIVGGGITDWPLFRRLVSSIANQYINTVLHFKNKQYGIKDSTSGFKVWQKQALESIKPETMHSDGYAFQIEAIWIACKQGLKVQEVPIIFRDRTAGASKIGRSNIFETLALPWRLS